MEEGSFYYEIQAKTLGGGSVQIGWVNDHFDADADAGKSPTHPPTHPPTHRLLYIHTYSSAFEPPSLPLFTQFNHPPTHPF